MKTQIEVGYPDNGLRCREVLKDIKPLKAERKGSYIKASLFFFAPILMLGLFIYFLDEFNPSASIFLIGSIFLMIGTFLLFLRASFEFMFIGYKYQTRFMIIYNPF